MRILLTIAVVVFAIPDRPDPTPKEARSSPERIIGDWRYAGAGKEPAPQAGLPNYVFRITATETIWMQNGQEQRGNGFTARATFDWTKDPAAIDMTPKRGGSPIHGIVKLDGDRLTLAWSNGGSTRPAVFAPSPNVHIHHFIRVKR